MHWSYDCTGSGHPGVFVVDVFEADKSPDFKFPGVNEQGDQDSSVYHVAGVGRFYLEITTTCSWRLKIFERP